MDFILTKKEEMVGNIKVGGRFDCNYNEVVPLKISRWEGTRQKPGSQPCTLGV